MSLTNRNQPGWLQRPAGSRCWAVLASLVLLLPLAVAPLSAEIRVERLPDGTVLLVGEGQRDRSKARSRTMRRREPPPAIAALIDVHCRRQSLEPGLVRAVIQAESDYDRRALSVKGAIGLMQLMPDTARDLGVSDPWDPGQNIDGGTRYLRQLLDRFGGDLEHALAGYNAGPSAVERYGGVPPYAETSAYVGKVLALYRGEGWVAKRRNAQPSSVLQSGPIQDYRPIQVKRQSDGTLMLISQD